MTQKQIAAILYNYYAETDMEDDYSFDDGKMLETVQKIIASLPEEEVEKLQSQIIRSECEGTDYPWLKYRHPDRPELFLQVTSMYDYRGNLPDGCKYTGPYDYIDAGMFFVNYKYIEFDELKDD
jgi:hypothetical protein